MNKRMLMAAGRFVGLMVVGITASNLTSGGLYSTLFLLGLMLYVECRD